MILKVLGSGSSGNCYLLEDSKGEVLVLECGIKISDLKKAVGHDISKIKGALVTHGHL